MSKIRIKDHSSPRESILKIFEEKYGSAPENLVRAPGRVKSHIIFYTNNLFHSKEKDFTEIQSRI